MNKASKILEKFEAYCTPRKNVTWQRHLFNTRNQRSDESFDQYLTDLKTKAQSCEFNETSRTFLSETESFVESYVIKLAAGCSENQTLHYKGQ